MQFVIRCGIAIIVVVVTGALSGPMGALTATSKIVAGIIAAAVLAPAIYVAAIVTAAAKIDRDKEATLGDLRRSLASVNDRKVKQSAIDALAVLRKEGVAIYANGPNPTLEGMVDWEKRWNDWRDRVVSALERDFTQAEALSFGHLGEIANRQFEHGINRSHIRYLAQLTKQLAILETLIESYQDKLRAVARDT